MKPVDIIPFKIEHAESVYAIEHQCLEVGSDEWRALMDNNTLRSPAWTGICDGEIIGCGGIRLFWKGVGEAWCIYPKNKILSYVKECFGYTEKALFMASDTYKLHRIQSTVRADFPKAMNWLGHLKFNIESKLSKYNADGTDAYLFSRLEV